MGINELVYSAYSYYIIIMCLVQKKMEDHMQSTIKHKYPYKPDLALLLPLGRARRKKSPPSPLKAWAKIDTAVEEFSIFSIKTDF